MTRKCDACPFAGTETACYAQAVGHSRFCTLVAEGRRGYRDLVVLKTAESGPVDPDLARAAVVARRAKKPRVALGSRTPQGRR